GAGAVHRVGGAGVVGEAGIDAARHLDGYAGAAGFKPTCGRIPEDPSFSLDTYCHQGPPVGSIVGAALTVSPGGGTA
ncbi:MAG: hypothetical protein GDA41_08865, partial [Rhodospirillales bacterium]|nr:hypothetical protein [Rhodospirillales bacterium]